MSLVDDGGVQVAQASRLLECYSGEATDMDVSLARIKVALARLRGYVSISFYYCYYHWLLYFTLISSVLSLGYHTGHRAMMKAVVVVVAPCVCTSRPWESCVD